MLALDSSNHLRGSASADAFTCNTCSQVFRRADHLRRHELSHGFPRYVCSHPRCGMRFHWHDVRDRHETVHQTSPSKQRRKARRGVFPRSWAQSIDSERAMSSATRLSGASDEGLQSQLPDASWDWSLDDIDIWIGGETDLIPDVIDNVVDFSTPHFTPDGPDDSISDAPGITVPQLTFSENEVLWTCLEHFQKSHLLRQPFIHEQTIKSPSLAREMKLAMAALGAVGIPGLAETGKRFYHQARRCLQSTTSLTQLSRLQCQVLLIDFAIWVSDDALFQWALSQGQQTAIPVLALMNTQPGETVNQSWEAWIHHEEVKRTIFAFYSIFANASLVFDSVIPLSSQQITLDLPDPDVLWAASSEFDWQLQKAANMSASRPNVSFQLALCTLLSCDTIQGDIYETATTFGQYILLCGIAEAFNIAKKLPINYSTTDAFRTSAMSAFGPRGIFMNSLKIWKSLWWVGVESHWDKTVYAIPQAESVFLLDHLLVALSHGCLEEGSGAQEGLAAAIEIFCGASKSGFSEVGQFGTQTFSTRARKHTMTCAKFMLDWLRVLVERGSEASTRDGNGELLCTVRQSVRRGLRQKSNSAGDLGSTEALRAYVEDLWILLYGTGEWCSS